MSKLFLLLGMLLALGARAQTTKVLEAPAAPAAAPGGAQPAHSGPLLDTARRKDIIVLRDGGKINGQVERITEKTIEYLAAGKPATITYTQPLADVLTIVYEDGSVRVFGEATQSAQTPQAVPGVQNSPAPAPDQPSTGYQYQPQHGQQAPQTSPNPAAGEPVQAAPAAGYQTQAPPAQQTYPYQAQPIQQPAYNSMMAYNQGQGDASVFYRRYKGARIGTLVGAFFTGALLGLIPAIACSSTAPSTDRLGIPPSPYQQDPNYMLGYKDTARKIKSHKTWGGYGLGTALLVGLLILTAR